ncbi:hypothetical protein [Natrialbaceae archaeon AArc-T1-2]|uniref:hypothetical protein n=1 Tax=Natrialbaceae archaeon AArc-T1-2 TaxID=3053904 RepID=UPI00255B2926|nr:hypothetical protein [Natrialbaceae archaeon AArc-T1-2]WIV67977.1 hypothetical protein QQ977_04390 [Natrialbaceae archaeon AArc-T1-2]
MNDSRTVQWRRDASNFRTVRILWALGSGTFVAAISLMIYGRFFALTGETGGQSVVIAALAAIAGVILVFAAINRTEGRLEAVLEAIPGVSVGDGRLQRVLDTAVGAVVMGAVIYGLAFGLGPGVGFFVAALTIPIALFLLVGSSFLQSVGSLDPDEKRLYLYEPEQSVDLDDVEDVSVRRIGETAIVKLRYAQPDGQYVKGPRRLVVPPAVARELQAIVRSR